MLSISLVTLVNLWYGDMVICASECACVCGCVSRKTATFMSILRFPLPSSLIQTGTKVTKHLTKHVKLELHLLLR